MVEELDEHIDTQTISEAQAKFDTDADDIDKIVEAIRQGNHKQTEILDAVKEQKLGKNKALRILRSYTQYEPIKLWNVERAFEKNAKLYYLRGKE